MKFSGIAIIKIKFVLLIGKKRNVSNLSVNDIFSDGILNNFTSPSILS